MAAKNVFNCGRSIFLLLAIFSQNKKIKMISVYQRSRRFCYMFILHGFWKFILYYYTVLLLSQIIYEINHI